MHWTKATWQKGGEIDQLESRISDLPRENKRLRGRIEVEEVVANSFVAFAPSGDARGFLLWFHNHKPSRVSEISSP